MKYFEYCKLIILPQVWKTDNSICHAKSRHLFYLIISSLFIKIDHNNSYKCAMTVPTKVAIHFAEF